MWIIRAIQEGFERSHQPPHIRRALMSYLDELAYHLDSAGFEGSTELEQAAVSLQAILADETAGPACAPPNGRIRTAPGMLLRSASEAVGCSAEESLQSALSSVIAHLDADLWLTPMAMESTHDRLAREVASRLTGVLA